MMLLAPTRIIDRPPGYISINPNPAVANYGYALTLPIATQCCAKLLTGPT
jgi:hypothetical protein